MAKIFLAAVCAAAIAGAGGSAEPAFAGSVRVRCQWRDPLDGHPLDFQFSGSPLIILPAGGQLEVSPADSAGALTLLRDGRPFRTDRTLLLAAPEKPGAYYLALRIEAGDSRRDLDLCVFVPYRASAGTAGKGRDVYVEGEKVGNYPLPMHSGNLKVRNNPESYQPPVLWFRLSPRNIGFEVVPGVAAGDLVAAAEDTGRRHTDLVPVGYGMWTAILRLREALERRGIPGSALKLISGFRAPPHNRAVGSNAFGRHIYGDAFDFYIDLEGDARASDLNRDGKVDRRDAYEIVSTIEDLQADGIIPRGGIGVYHTLGGDHGLTMHLDLRGHRANWGYHYSAGGKRSEFAWDSRRFRDEQRREEDEARARAAKEGKPYRRPRREPLPPSDARLR
ncbi:MAG: hypothetical protein LBT97_08225 [Planctomycetota bacterium]|jgi:hypothetical protein|nr:hypothetical protein [Planctomycetota bacterium]